MSAAAMLRNMAVRWLEVRCSLRWPTRCRMISCPSFVGGPYEVPRSRPHFGWRLTYPDNEERRSKGPAVALASTRKAPRSQVSMPDRPQPDQLWEFGAVSLAAPLL